MVLDADLTSTLCNVGAIDFGKSRAYMAGAWAGFGLLVLLSFAFLAAFIRCSARLATGSWPTWGSTFLAMIVSVIVSLITAWLSNGTKNPQSTAIWAGLISFAIQAYIYSVTLEMENGTRVNVLQGALIIVMQWAIMASIILGMWAIFKPAGASYKVLFEQARTMAAVVTGRPTPAPLRLPREARLRAPMTLNMRYGQVKAPAGMSVMVREEMAQGYVVEVSGEEVMLKKEHVVLVP